MLIKRTLTILRKMHSIKTFVFIDTETTGLPFEEHNRTKLTELSLVAVQADHIRLGVFPRVQNKLNLCFNPQKFINPTATDLTGLSNDLLEFQAKFTKDTANLINNFLNHHQNPICFVAHNGNNFDYPIIRRELQKVEHNLLEDILCIDTMETFKDILIQSNEFDCVDSRPPEKFLKLEGTDSDLHNSTERTEHVLSIQKQNETTPKKQIITANQNEHSGVRKRLYFGPSNLKLSNIYQNLTNKKAINIHQAEGDVLLLLTCATTLGSKFVNWANENAKNFSDVPVMVPGKKIGT